MLVNTIKIAVALATLLSPLYTYGSPDIYTKLNNHYLRGNAEVANTLAQRELSQGKLKAEDRLVVLHHLIMIKGANDLRDAGKYLKEFKKTYLQISRELQKQSNKTNTVERYIDARLLDSYYFMALFDAINGDYNDAYLMFVILEPHGYNTEDYWGWFGISAQKTGAYDISLAAFQQQQKLNPKNPAISYNLACVYAKKGEHKAALRELHRAIKMDPKYKSEATKDPDFKNYYNSPEFIKLITE